MRASRFSFFILGLITLIGFSLLGYVIIEFFYDFTLLERLAHSRPVFLQILWGLFAGGVVAIILLGIIHLPFLKDSRNYFTHIIRNAKLKLPDILFLSLAAGIGEEILFRGAIQPFLGIWPTAVLFVALHGYLNPYNLRISIYGFIMVFVSAGLGYLFEIVGPYSAMAAHFIIDVILFAHFLYAPGQTKTSPVGIDSSTDSDENEHL